MTCKQVWIVVESQQYGGDVFVDAFATSDEVDAYMKRDDGWRDYRDRYYDFYCLDLATHEVCKGEDNAPLGDGSLPEG